MHPINRSPSQILKYYYEPDPIFGVDSSWYGHGAKRYGLCDLPCQIQDFANLTSGNDLNGNQVIKSGRDIDDKEFHRAAVDLTFSPPKSVSITAEHAGKLKIITAHKNAVDSTLEYIEDNYVYARLTKFNCTSAEKTGEGLFAKFHHSVSRANDPNLHTHCLILNHTNGPKGPCAVFFDRLYQDQRLITLVYLSHLAKNLQDLGYKIDAKSNGTWEIAGVKPEWIHQFSKRSQTISIVEKNLSKTSKYERARESVLRRIAVLKSRPPKDHSLDGAVIRDGWEKQVPRDLIIQAVEKAKGKDVLVGKLNPADYIRLAYQTIHETECLFTRKQILESSLNLGMGNVSINDIEKSFSGMRVSGEIIDVSTRVNSKGIETKHFTSDHMKEVEQEILKAFCNGISSVDSFLPELKAEKIIRTDHPHLTTDQKEALQKILSSKDRCILLQGDAGTGKSFLFKSLKEILEGRDIEIQGLGYTGKAAQELQAKSGIPSKTISSFLNGLDPKKHQKEILIVDEASMLGSLQANEIFAKARSNDSRVILCGDCKQLQAISAGKFFKDLQELGVPRIKLNQVLRQKNIIMLKAVSLVKDFQNGKNPSGIDDTFELLNQDGHLMEERDNSKLIGAVSDKYFSIQNPDDTMIIAASNHERIALNQFIRAELQKAGSIDPKNHEIQISVPVSLPGIKKFFAENFEVGQSVFVNQRNPETGEKEYFDSIIVSVDLKNNALSVLSKDNVLRNINLRDKVRRPKITIFDVQERNFSAGDRIVFVKNDRELGIQNGLTGQIVAVDQDGTFQIRIKNSNRLLKITPEKYPWIDHSYAISIHKAQGQTSPNVIFLANTRNKKLNKTESLYVALSRAENQVDIFTNNIERLKGQFKAGQEKTSTLTPGKNITKSKTHEKQSDMEIEK